MKTILKITTVVAFMLSTVVSTAREPKVNLVAFNEAKSLVLSMENTSSDFGIRFIDEEDHIIYSGKLTDGSFVRKFDLTNLKNGIYYVSTEDEAKSYVYTISLKGKEVKIVEKEETNKPYFRKAGDRLYMNFLNLDKSKVGVKVYDEEYRVVFADTYEDIMILEKAFNFIDAYKGSYTVVVSTNDKTYSEDFIVN